MTLTQHTGNTGTAGTVFDTLRGGVIVSCQAEGDSPFNSPEGVVSFARAAAAGGAAGIRSEGVAKTAAIVQALRLPVIGLVKSAFPDGMVRITGSFRDVDDLIAAGAAVIAIDGTFREREGCTGPEFIAAVKKNRQCIVMADIATVEEARACADAGADCISTTLSGYTPETRNHDPASPDYDLVKTLAHRLAVPVFAEGRITTPAMAAEMKSLGAWAVVVGSAITRPSVITQWYVEAMTSASKPGVPR